MTEEAVSITIPDDDPGIVKTTGADEGAAVVVAKTTKTEPPPELADMKRQLDESKAREANERSRAAEAERIAREQAELRGRAETQVADSRVSTVASAIEAEEAKASNAERDYETALAGGDFKAASKAQREMSAAEARLQLLSRDKAELEAAPKREPAHEGAVRTSELPSDPTEAFIVRTRLGPKAAAWVRSHPDVVNDPQALTGAHHAAVGLDKTRPDTPEYFAAIEKHLGIGGRTAIDTGQQQQEQRQDPPRRQAATASAPVGAGGGTGTRASQSNIVTLSAQERDMARSLYPDMNSSEAEKQYATNKLALIREGKLTAA